MLGRLCQCDVIYFERIPVDDVHVILADQCFGQMRDQCLVKLNSDDVRGPLGEMVCECAEAGADFEDEVVGLYLRTIHNAASHCIVD